MSARIRRPTLASALACFVALVSLVSSSASHTQQPTEHVALRDLTVEDRPPPNYLRASLDDHTTGVMRGFDRCFAERAEAVPGLAGTLALRLWVSARQVIRVTPETQSYADTELTACVKRVLLAFRLPDSAPSAGATVRFRLEFAGLAEGMVRRCEGLSCRDVACGTLGAPCCPAAVCAASVCTEGVCAEPPPPPPPPPPRATMIVVRARGGLSPDELGASIDRAPLEACVPDGVRGRLPLDLTVTRAGAVRTTQRSGTLRDRTVIRCLRSALAAQTLPSTARTTYARVEVRVGEDARLE